MEGGLRKEREMIESYLLEHLVVFSEHRTLSETASVLHLTQPTLTRSMNKLEETFGVPLFTREKKRIRLNENGWMAASYAKEILREDEELKYIVGIPKTDKSLAEFEKEILETSVNCNSVKVKELVSFLLALDNEEDLKAVLLCTMNEILDVLLKVEAKDNIFQDFEWC